MEESLTQLPAWASKAVMRRWYTPQGIVQNLVHLVNLYGHVPNGSRSYYINRR